MSFQHKTRKKNELDRVLLFLWHKNSRFHRHNMLRIQGYFNAEREIKKPERQKGKA